MAIWDRFLTPKTIKEIHIYKTPSNLVQETLKGMPNLNTIKLGTDNRVEHPEKYEDNELMVFGIPLLAGAIDKTVDYVVGSGYYIESKNAQTKKALEDFMVKHNFNLFLRNIAHDLLVYGNVYVEIVKAMDSREPIPISISELKVWSPKNIFIKMNDKGETMEYIQVVGKSKDVHFKTSEIVHFKFKILGDLPYGVSAIESLRKVLMTKLQIENDSAKVVHKKAACPIHYQLGGERGGQYIEATATELDSVYADATTLENRNDFISSDLVKITPIDINIGRELPYLEHFDNQLIYGLQVPEVLLGKGNVPEGLANAQMKTFLLRVQAIQDSIKATLCEKILTEHLRLFKIPRSDYDYEFVWGMPDFVKEQEINMLKLLLDTTSLSDLTKTDIENRIRTLLDFTGQVLPTMLNKPQPPQFPFGSKESADITLREWLCHEFSGNLQHILDYLEKRDFKDISSLDRRMVDKFRETLKDAFKQGYSVNKVAEDIKPYLKDKSMAEVVARTELSRASAEGELNRYKESNLVKEVVWTTPITPTTCEVCKKQNGKKYPIEKARGLIPEHPNCRCYWNAVV